MNDETKNDVAAVCAALDLLEEFNLPYIVDKLANALAALDRLEGRVATLEHELGTRELVRRTNLKVNKALSQDIIAVKADRDTLAQRLATARELFTRLTLAWPTERAWSWDDLTSVMEDVRALNATDSLAQPLPDHVRVVPSEASEATAPHTPPDPA